MKQIIQHNPPHPGEILSELYFAPLKLTVTDAAAKLLITRPNLSAIINGKAGISPVMALKLAKASTLLLNIGLTSRLTMTFGR